MRRTNAQIYDEHERMVAAREAMGWETDDLGWYGPNPFNPDDFCIREEDWEERTGFPLPEDMDPADRELIEAMREHQVFDLSDQTPPAVIA